MIGHRDRQSPAPQTTPAPLTESRAEPATVDACKQDYARGAADRENLDRTAQRQYPTTQ